MVEVDARDARIAQLEKRLEAALERIAQLEEENERLREENRWLKERMGLNSSNSSKPPSSDTPGTPRQGKRPTGRRPGGQPGHKKHERALLPPEDVQHVVELVPRECRGCKRRLNGQDTAPRRHQVVEVPPLSAIVTEYRCHALQCPGCGVVTRGEVPVHARSVFGDRLTALASLLVGKYRLSKRLVKDALSDMLGVELSVGSVSNLEGEMSEALAPPTAEALAYVQTSEAVNADETGFAQGREGGRAGRAWLWVVATALVVVFHIARSRGGKVARQLLGADFAGFLTTDRWSAYAWVDAGLRQLCWAHLTRDFQGFIDRGGRGGRIGRELMRERNRFFKWYHRVRDGTLSRERFEERMRGVERRVGQLLRAAALRAEKKTAGMAREILQWEKCLWTFVDVPGLEPTNNFGERCIRHAVMYRKTSFGTQSEEGSRFVERIFTSTTTLKLQGRDVLAFLTETLAAHRRGLRGPSLLPSAPEPQLALTA
ncbi:IS66 family transposase [Melittangium boletus]|uniref:Mobile element protein n=1 Tax=Melittangium boletus DSM 14713 TaxID=1294270 RepID=A0A250IKD4_9BACT|nr:IS66 family transposase [Melittangium boletus]ATB31682.1 Mobile element protein [Melittangium boletus DSM 14713]